MLVLVWVLLLIALALATLANLTAARATDVQPALSNQNVSGRYIPNRAPGPQL